MPSKNKNYNIMEFNDLRKTAHKCLNVTIPVEIEIEIKPARDSDTDRDSATDMLQNVLP